MIPLIAVVGLTMISPTWLMSQILPVSVRVILSGIHALFLQLQQNGVSDCLWIIVSLLFSVTKHRKFSCNHVNCHVLVYLKT